MGVSHLEEALLAQIREAGLPEPTREARVCKERRWRLDFLWENDGFPGGLAVEVEGATWANGRHNRGAGYASDVEKYNTCLLRGIRVLRVTGDMVKDGTAIRLIRRAIEGGE